MLHSLDLVEALHTLLDLNWKLDGEVVTQLPNVFCHLSVYVMEPIKVGNENLSELEDKLLLFDAGIISQHLERDHPDILEKVLEVYVH